MSTRSERITILGTPEFKSWLAAEARREGISVSELIRRRVDPREHSDEERLLAELVREVRRTTREAEASLERGLASAEAVLAELRAR